MASALDEFRAQREAANDVHARLTGGRRAAQFPEAGHREPRARRDACGISCRKNRRGSARAETVLAQARQASRVGGAAFLAGGVATLGWWRWPSRWPRRSPPALDMAGPAGRYEAELASLRSRAELGDAVAQRVFRMTPGRTQAVRGADEVERRDQTVTVDPAIAARLKHGARRRQGCPRFARRLRRP